MEIERKVRIISDYPEIVEAAVNPLMEDYTPVVWNVQTGEHGPWVTCILITNRFLLQQQLAAARVVQGRPL